MPDCVSTPAHAWVEALALFRSYGFVEIDDYNGNPYAEHWLELRLDDAETA